MSSYRRLRLFAVTLLVVEFVVGMGGWLTSRHEVFPFASWFLFTLVPHRTTEYDLEFRAANDRPLDPPVRFSRASGLTYQPHSITAFNLIQSLGVALEHGDARQSGTLRAQVDLLCYSGRLRYDVVKVTYDPRRPLRLRGRLAAPGARHLHDSPAMKAAALLHRCRRSFTGPPAPRAESPFRAQPRRFTAAQTLVRAFYALTLYLAVTQFTTMGDLLARRPYAQLWPVAWLHWTHGTQGVYALLAFYLATNVLGPFFAEARAARIAVFLGLLGVRSRSRTASARSATACTCRSSSPRVLVCLPAGWTRPAPLASRRLRQQTLLTFWLAQAVILLSYTMSSLGKLGGGLWQLVTRPAQRLPARGLRLSTSPSASSRPAATAASATGSFTIPSSPGR